MKAPFWLLGNPCYWISLLPSIWISLPLFPTHSPFHSAFVPVAPPVFGALLQSGPSRSILIELGLDQLLRLAWGWLSGMITKLPTVVKKVLVESYSQVPCDGIKRNTKNCTWTILSFQQEIKRLQSLFRRYWMVSKVIRVEVVVGRLLNSKWRF